MAAGGPAVWPRDTTGPPGVWTGRELLVLVLDALVPEPDFLSERRTFTLFRYEPARDAWSEATHVPVAGLYRPVLVWTGSRLIVWGERRARVPVVIRSGETVERVVYLPENAGALWDPATDTWTPISIDGSPTQRIDFAAAWTGTRLVVWGGDLDVGGGGGLQGGGVYDVDADAWEPLSPEGEPTGRKDPLSAWTGSELLVWGGQYIMPSGNGSIRDDGAAYNPATASWRALPPAPDAVGGEGATAVWTGDRMIVFGGRPLESLFPRWLSRAPSNEGASYVPPCLAMAANDLDAPASDGPESARVLSTANDHGR
jgi:hypothetical protein